MKADSQSIDSLIQKINKILGKYIDLEEKYLNMLEENKVLKAQLNQDKEQINELENNIKVLKISKGSAEGGSDHTELKLKINEYIKEIDKCMAMLNV